jgi:ADP-ribose pyrophosphatase YjhB (NUDIX family)
MVIVCVDLVLRRASDGKVLLVKRGTEPVKGYWWL